VLHDLSVSWRLFDGHDWDELEPLEEGRRQGEAGGEDSAEGADRRSELLLRSLLGGSGADGEAQEKGAGRARRRRIPGTSARNAECMLEVCLSHVCARVDSFAPGSETSSALFVGVRDFHILDRILTAQPRRIVGYW
jgi:hypothetical protein